MPSAYEKNKPTALVFNFHGTGGNPAHQVEISDLETLAEQEDFISVSPSAIYQHTEDGVNHYIVNEDSPPYWRTGVETAINGWLKNNHCNQEANSLELEDQVTLIRYAQCRDDAGLVFYQSAIAGHTWPGSKVADKIARAGLGVTDKHIYATHLIWEFFDTHPLLVKE